MILNSVIIVLREALEAALLVSLLLAFSQHFQLSFRWTIWGVASGAVGAVLYAKNLAVISDLFDGVGQEILNASIILTQIVLIFIISICIVRKKYDYLVFFMIPIVMFAISMEGAEIIIYSAGFAVKKEMFTSAISGGVIGLGIGLSIGALLYYSLTSLKGKTYFAISFSLLALVTAGFSAQFINLLVQADWIDSHSFIWDTSAVVSENSIFGQLLYAAIGYEATPTIHQVVAYCLMLVGFISIYVVNYKNLVK